MKNVTVIGGGIAGLTAAYELEQKGEGAFNITLVEAASQLGGKLLTGYDRGFAIEGGPDCYLASKRAVARLGGEVGIADDIIGTSEENKGTFILSRGKLHSLPEGLMLMVPTKILPFAASSLISWPGKLRMSLDLVIPRSKNSQDESLGSFVTRRLGQEALVKIAEPLIGGIHAGDPESMSLRASFPRFLDMEKNHRSLIKAMLTAKRHAPKQPTSGSTYFMSFKEGMGQLPTAVAERLQQVKVKLDTRVLSLSYQDQSYTVSTDSGEQWQADAVVLAVPAFSAADIIADLDDQLAQIMKSINFVNAATVSLAFKREDIKRPLQGFGFLIPANENRDIMAVTYSSRKFAHRVPDDKYQLVRCFVGGPKKQEMVLLDDEEMLNKVRSELKDIIGLTAAPVLTKIYRWLQGMPQYTLGHLDRVDSIEKRLAAYPGLYIAGNSYRGIGVPDCIESGIRAAENIIKSA